MFGDSKNAMLRVDGMSCAHCQQKVNHVLNSVKGVKSAAVDLETGRATVVFNNKKTDLDHMSRAVRDAGFEVTEARMV